MVVPNTIEIPGSSSSGPDIYAATRVVSLIPGDGTDLTIAAALAALPAAGGRIFVKQGVYPQTAPLVFPNAPVDLVGASESFGVGGTIIDIGANFISAFAKVNSKQIRIANLTVRGAGIFAQSFFDSSVVADGSNYVVVENVRVDQIQDGFIANGGGGLSVRMSKFNFTPSILADARLWTGGGGDLEAEMSIADFAVIEGNPHLKLSECDFRCVILSGPFVNLVGSIAATSSRIWGGYRVVKSKLTAIVGCQLSIFGGGPAVDRYLDFPVGGGLPATVANCTFESPAAVEEIRVASDGVSVYGNIGVAGTFVPKVTEIGTANNNRYEDIALSSTIIGANSIVCQWNTRTTAVDITLTEADRTVLVDASGAARTITLPTAATARYRKYTIKKIDASANTVTIDADGAELIDGALTVVIGVQYGSITVQSNGTSWSVVVSDASGPFGIFAASRIVSLVPGEGTDLTIAAAIAALPAAGGDIYVKGGTYPIAASLDFGVKVVRLRGAGTSVNFTTGPTTLVPAAGVTLFKNGAAGSSVEDITAEGDNATSQIFYEGNAEVRFSRVNVHDIAGIIAGPGGFNMPEILFRDSYLNVPSNPAIPLADRYVWKGTAADGTLIFDNVELFISGGGQTLMSGVSGAANGPTFKVVNSYVGGGGGGGTTNFWFAQQVEWTQFEIDNAQFEISGAFNTIVNCGFLDFSIKFLAVWNYIANSKFSQGGTGGLLFDAQLTFAPSAPATPVHSTVVGCHFFGNAAALKGISFLGMKQGSVSGCVFDGHSTEAIEVGSTATNGSQNIEITGCTFTGDSGGGTRFIDINSTPVLSFRITVTGNTFDGSRTPAIRNAGTRCIVSDNVLCTVTETGGANNNLYENNTDFDNSGIIGGACKIDNENVTATSLDITLTDDHRTVPVDASGAARTITLPTAASAKWRKYIIKKTDATVNTVTIDADAAETIDGSLTFVLTVQYQAIEIQSDGTTWWII